MISMKKNAELFWILEILLVTPVALFWMGIVSKMLGSDSLFMAVLGSPYSLIRSAFITLACPAAAAWFAYEYIRENKREKGTKGTCDIAKSIIAICLATIAIVLIYVFLGNPT